MQVLQAPSLQRQSNRVPALISYTAVTAEFEVELPYKQVFAPLKTALAALNIKFHYIAKNETLDFLTSGIIFAYI